MQVGFRIYPAASTRIWLVPLLFGLYLLGLALFWAALTPARWLHRGRTWILFATLVGVIAGFAVEVTVYDRGYDADGLVFSHIAAEQVLAGRNPYTLGSESLTGEFNRFGFPTHFVTPTVDGQPFDGLIAYPALHFLIFVPAVAAGLKDLRWMTLAFEVASLWVLFRFSHRSTQPLVLLPLLVNTDLVLRFPAGSGTDWIWVLPLLLCAVLLTRRRAGLAGVAFGIACATTQLVWGAAPFLAIWLVKTYDRSRPHAGESIRSFFGATTAAFLLPNVPFIVSDLPSWVHGVLAPLRSDLVYDGQGLSLLSKMGLLPVPREFYGVIVLVLGLAGMATYWIFFPTLRRALWAFPATLMWFAYRSMHNYLIFWLPIGLLWFALPDHSQFAEAEGGVEKARQPLAVPRRASASRRAVLSLLTGVALAGSLSALAFGSTHGIGWRVIRLEDRHRLGAVDAIVVEVTNRFRTIFEPVFSVMQWGFPIAWDIEEGPKQLRSGETAVYRISAPVADALLLPRDGVQAPKSGQAAPSYLRLEVQGGVDRDLSGQLVEIAPAYLRLNDKGKYPIYTIRLSGYTAVRPQTLNPEFRYWRIQDRTTMRSAPIGWWLETRPAGNRNAEAREQSFEGRRTVSLALNPSGTPGWEHIGLRQEISSPVCVAFSAYLTRPFRSQEGGPVEAQGIELAYRSRLVWYVFSNEVDAPRSTQLSNGSRLVVVPERLQAWNDVMLDVRSEVERLGGAGQLVSLKVFVALNGSLVDRSLGPRTMRISRLDASPKPCPGKK